MDRPKKVIGRKLVGCHAFCNSTWQSFDCADSESAKEALQSQVDFEIAWRLGSKMEDEGNYVLIGMHPDVLIGLDESGGLNEEFSARYAGFGGDRKILCERIGEAAYTFRAHVRPSYEDIFEPIGGAVRAFADSRYYIAPNQSGWGIFLENNTSGPRWIENHFSKDESLMYARRLALGFETALKSKERRNNAFLLILLIIAAVVLIVLFPN